MYCSMCATWCFCAHMKIKRTDWWLTDSCLFFQCFVCALSLPDPVSVSGSEGGSGFLIWQCTCWPWSPDCPWHAPNCHWQRRPYPPGLSSGSLNILFLVCRAVGHYDGSGRVYHLSVLSSFLLSQNAVVYSAQVHALGRYVFILHYHQPLHPTFTVQMYVNGGRIWQGKDQSAMLHTIRYVFRLLQVNDAQQHSVLLFYSVVSYLLKMFSCWLFKL